MSFRTQNMVVGNNEERRFPVHGDAKNLGHVKIIRLNLMQQLPIKLMDKLRQSHLHSRQTEGYSRANSPARSKRNQLEMLAPKINVWVQESIGIKLLWILPVFSVPTYGPCIDELLAGMVWPLIVICAMDSRGRSRGAGGCNLMTSLITAFMYFRLGRSVSDTISFSPTTFLTSDWRILRISGWVSSSVMVQSKVMNDVSVPAANISCTQTQIKYLSSLLAYDNKMQFLELHKYNIYVFFLSKRY